MAWGTGLKCEFGMIVINDEADLMDLKCTINKALPSESIYHSRASNSLSLSECPISQSVSHQLDPKYQLIDGPKIVN